MRRFAVVMPLALFVALLAVGPTVAFAAGPNSTTVTLPNGPWAVPAGVTCARFSVHGAAGGASGDGAPIAGGAGAILTATVLVAGTVAVTVGDAGASDVSGSDTGKGGAVGGAATPRS